MFSMFPSKQSNERRRTRAFRLKLAGLLAAAVFLVGSEAGAVTTYTYTGDNFGIFFDQDPPPGTYTSSMSVSGFFTLSSPLAANVISFFNNPLSFSFSDGRNTFTDITPDTISLFLFETDALGKIFSWTFLIRTEEVGQSVFEIISTTDRDVFGFFDRGQFALAGGTDEGVSFLRPGQWSVTTDSLTPPVPLPATLPLFATGLGALGLLGWRRKRRGA
jgi:hypothetical protein